MFKKNPKYQEYVTPIYREAREGREEHAKIFYGNCVTHVYKRFVTHVCDRTRG